MAITLIPRFVEELPLSIGKFKVNYVESLRPLIERPGEWALLKEFTHSGNAHSTGRHLQEGRLRIPRGRWEFQVINSEAKKWHLYARYLGE
jgi:hypothetical protein